MQSIRHLARSLDPTTSHRAAKRDADFPGIQRRVFGDCIKGRDPQGRVEIAFLAHCDGLYVCNEGSGLNCLGIPA